MTHKTQITGPFLPLVVEWPFMAPDELVVSIADDMSLCRDEYVRGMKGGMMQKREERWGVNLPVYSAKALKTITHV